MPIVLRLIKGSELTFAELDGNFQDLDNRTDALEAIDAGTRLTRLEAAGTPSYYDSDDTEVILDSIWGGTVTNYLATTDSIGLASFDSDHFNVNNGHVTIKLAGYTPSDSAGIASFDSSEFVVTDGHVTINPNSAPGRYASYTPIDSTGVASFDSANFVVTNGHVTINPNSAAGRVARYTEIDSTGVASFDSSDFTVSVNGHVTLNIASITETGVASFDSADFSVNGSGHVTLASSSSGTPVGFSSGGSIYYPASFLASVETDTPGSGGYKTMTFDPFESSRFPFEPGARYVGNIRFYIRYQNGNGDNYDWMGLYNHPGATDDDGISWQNSNRYYITLEDATMHGGGVDHIEWTAGSNCRFKVVAVVPSGFATLGYSVGVSNTKTARNNNNDFWYMRIA